MEEENEEFSPKESEKIGKIVKPSMGLKIRMSDSDQSCARVTYHS
jgi:hypothetical protein